MTTMRAIDVKGGTGPASSLFINDNVPKPKPSSSECLVKVKAFGLNRADTLQREGKYPPPAGVTHIMGLEFSGMIEEVGQGTSKAKEEEEEEEESSPSKEIWNQGDQVYGLVYGGAYAEYVTVHKTMLLRKPAELSWEECAAVPEVWMTALQAIHLLGKYSPKTTPSILWHAGTSAVSLAGIQLCKRLSSPPPKIYTTARQDEKCAFLKETYAVEAAINSTKSYPLFNPSSHYQQQQQQEQGGRGGKEEEEEEEEERGGDWSSELLRLTHGTGISLIIDFIGAPYFSSNLSLLAKDGICVCLGIMGGTILPEKVDIGPFVMKRVTFVGSTLRSRSVGYQRKLRELFERDVVPGLRGGVYKAGVDRVVSWREIGKMHLALEGNETKGKIVCLVD